MADRLLQQYKSFIIGLYKNQFPEEEIAKKLCLVGVETTFSEIQQSLEIWHVIPCPSPVHSNGTGADLDATSDRPQQRQCLKLGVTCHHGETSHISAIGTAAIVLDITPVEKYRQDVQSHEEFAIGLPISNEERVKRRELLINDLIIEEISGADIYLENEIPQEIIFADVNTEEASGADIYLENEIPQEIIFADVNTEEASGADIYLENGIPQEIIFADVNTEEASDADSDLVREILEHVKNGIRRANREPMVESSTHPRIHRHQRVRKRTDDVSK